MADNTTLPPGSGGDNIRSLDRAGVKTQVAALDIGGSGAELLVSKINPIPAGGIRRDSDATYGADGDSVPLQFNALGRLKVSVTPADTAAVTGSITANGQTVVSDATRQSNLAISMVATSLVGHNVSFEGSNNSTNGTDGTWYSLQVVRSNSNTVETASGVLAATPAYLWHVNVADVRWFRVRATAHTSGTAAYTLQPSAFATEPIPAAQVSATQPVSFTQPALVAGTANIGGVVVRNVATTNGYTRTRFTAAASTNGTVLKASAGTLVRYRLTNTTGTDVFLKFSNSATITVGTTAVAYVVRIPANATVSDDYIEGGEFFSAGISFGMTGLLADADTTAIAAGAIYGFFTWV